MPNDPQAGVEYAGVLPIYNGDNYLNSYYRAKQSAQQDQQLELQKEARLQSAAAAKVAAWNKQQDDQIKYLDSQKNDPAYKSADGYVQPQLDAVLAQGVNDMSKAIASGKADDISLRMMGNNYRTVAQKINTRGAAFASSLKQVADAWKMEGVNNERIAPLVHEYLAKNDPNGDIEITPELFNKIVSEHLPLLVDDPFKGQSNYFKNNIGKQKIDVGTQANGRMTAGGMEYDIPNDTKVVTDAKGNPHVVVKGDEFKGFGDEINTTDPVFSTSKDGSTITGVADYASWMANDAGKKNLKGIETYILKNIGGNKGNTPLYDEEEYNRLMQNKAAATGLNAQFHQEAIKYEAEMGKPFPMGTPMEDIFKRAILYKNRTADIEATVKKITPTSIYHPPTGGGGSRSSSSGGKTPGEVVINDIWGEGIDIIDGNTNASNPKGNTPLQDMPVEMQDAVMKHLNDTKKVSMDGADSDNVIVYRDGKYLKALKVTKDKKTGEIKTKTELGIVSAEIATNKGKAQANTKANVKVVEQVNAKSENANKFKKEATAPTRNKPKLTKDQQAAADRIRNANNLN